MAKHERFMFLPSEAMEAHGHVAWDVYITDDSTPPRYVGTINDWSVCEMLSQAPALAQLRDINRGAGGVAQNLRPRSYEKSILGLMGSGVARVLEKLR